MYVGSRDITLDIYGGVFKSDSAAQWNGTLLAITYLGPSHIQATIPASSMTALGTGQLVIANPDGSASSPFSIDIMANPVPTLSYVSPQSAPAGSKRIDVILSGAGFTNASTAYWETTPLETTISGTQLRATLTPQHLQRVGTFNISVVNPGPGGGGTSSSMPFSTYLPIATNDLVYSSSLKMLYASVPSTAGSLGNSVVAIDPVTGNVISSVFVGSEPNKLALSSDGKVLWVGVDGASAVRKVDLTTMTASTQFVLGENAGIYNSPKTALDLAVMPGSPDTVAIYTQAFPNATIRIFDAGIPRAKSYTGGGYLAFDSTGTKIYTIAGSSGWGSGYAVLTVDSTGIASARVLNSSGALNSAFKYDNGRIYTPSGTVIDAETGSLLATFYSQPNTVAYGSVAPDSTLAKVFILSSDYYASQNQIIAFDTTTFVKTGSVSYAGLTSTSSNASSLVRWGQNGLAFRTASQIYILQSNIVRDMSSTPADVGVSLSAPANTTTGTNLTYTATVTNSGPNTANNVVLVNSLPNGVTLVSNAPAQGTCGGSAVAWCNLGAIAKGASVQVQFTVTPTTAGALADTATVSATEPDPDITNNTATTSVAITGSDYNPVPFISGLSPNLVEVDSPTFVLKVTGAGFASSSTVQWNGSLLPTSFVDANTLTATVDSAYLTDLAYAWISVSSPAPGGGTSSAVPVMGYRVISLDASQIAFEPFRRKIYASVSSTATQLTGNSIVSIDPLTGTVSSPVNIGSEPNSLTFSDDGNYMFVGLDGSGSISRFNLSTNSPEFSFSLGSTYSGSAYKARSIAVAPGNPNLLAVDVGGIGIWDITGTTAAPRGFGGYYSASVVFADSTHLYSYDADSTGAEFYRWTLSSSGVTLLDDSTLNGMGGFGGGFKLARGIIFGAGGGVANPSTTPPSMLGRYATSGSVAPDPWLGRTFFLGCKTTDYYCSAGNALLAFDQTTFRRTDLLALPTDQGKNLIRWGSDGLAFRSSTSSSYTPVAGSGLIYIVRGPFVSPELGVAHARPTLTSVSPSQVSAGTGNIYVTVVGSGFVPGASARWNNSERTTYFVDSTHLSVAIPAADLANSGTASITVLNPGSATPSSGVSFTIAQ